MPERGPEQVVPAPKKITSPEQYAGQPEAASLHEQYAEQPKVTRPEAFSRFRKKQRAAATPAPIAPTTGAKNPELLEIENILAEGLDDFFRQLSPLQQTEFKTTGEATAARISQALREKTTRIKDIVMLIIGWLKTLPGINKFFLEQEAKIKADAIYRRYRP